MEDNIKKRIYFIFSQEGTDNIPYHLEKNKIIDNIQILNQEITANYSYTLYSISINCNINIKSFSLLLNSQNENFMAQIDCNKVYPEIFIYKIEFKPMEKNNLININQINLPVSEQFYIFKSNLNNNNSIKYLLLNSFDFILISNKKIKFEFYFFLFLFGNSLYLNMENSEDKMLYTFFTFFAPDLIDEDNSYKKNYLNNKILEIFGKNVIELLSDINMIYTIIYSLVSDVEENEENKIINKFEIILSYYYINYCPKLFVKLLSKNENSRYKLISDNLIQNRKIFKNFSSEILNFDLFDEVENSEDFYNLFLLISNIPEMFKIISDYMIFNKLCAICLKDNKIVNVIKIIKPKIEDDLELLNKSFDDISTLVLDGGYIPFKMDDDLFLAYCDFFYEKDIEKIEQIIKLNQKYYSILPKENNLVKEDLYNYYDETGIFLIKAGKLINKNLLTFLETRQKLLNREIKLIFSFFFFFL